MLRRFVAFAALLVLAFAGCKDQPGPLKGGTVFYPGGGDATVTTAAYTSSIALSVGHRVMTWAGGAAAATLVRASTGHADGGEVTVVYPANTATGLTVSADFNCHGDVLRNGTTGALAPWDATKPHVIELSQIGGFTECAVLEMVVPDATAPTIVSATATAGNANAVTLTFSEPVWFGGLSTGITAHFSVGTARTITAIESGDGTSSPVFTLSGNLDGSESFTVSVDVGRTATDLSGNLLATNAGVSVAISGFSSSLAAQANWTQCFESAVTMSPSTSLPANFLTWTTGVSPFSLQVVPATGTPPARTAAPDAALRFSAPNVGTGIQRVHVAASLGSGDWAFLARASDLTTGQWTYLDWNTSGVDNVRAKLQFNSTGVTFEAFDGSAEVLHEIPFTLVANTFYITSVKRVSGTVTITVHGQTPASVSDSTVLTSINDVTIGAEWTGGGGIQEGERGDFTDLCWMTGHSYTGSEEANAIAYLVAR